MEDQRSADPFWQHWPSRLPEQAPHESVVRYHSAFRLHFGCLWNITHVEQPSCGQILVVARALKNNGSMTTRAFAETLEAPIRALLARAEKAIE